MLFDPDSAGERALERADATVQELERADGDPNTVAAATQLKLDMRVLRLTEDPADWLLQHTPEEFEELLVRGRDPSRVPVPQESREGAGGGRSRTFADDVRDPGPHQPYRRPCLLQGRPTRGRRSPRCEPGRAAERSPAAVNVASVTP